MKRCRHERLASSSQRHRHCTAMSLHRTPKSRTARARGGLPCRPPRRDDSGGDCPPGTEPVFLRKGASEGLLHVWCNAPVAPLAARVQRAIAAAVPLPAPRDFIGFGELLQDGTIPQHDAGEGVYNSRGLGGQPVRGVCRCRARSGVWQVRRGGGCGNRDRLGTSPGAAPKAENGRQAPTIRLASVFLGGKRGMRLPSDGSVSLPNDPPGRLPNDTRAPCSVTTARSCRGPLP